MIANRIQDDSVDAHWSHYFQSETLCDDVTLAKPLLLDVLVHSRHKQRHSMQNAYFVQVSSDYEDLMWPRLAIKCSLNPQRGIIIKLFFQVSLSVGSNSFSPLSPTICIECGRCSCCVASSAILRM